MCIRDRYETPPQFRLVLQGHWGWHDALVWAGNQRLSETEAARVDPRQLALIAEPPIALAEMPVRVMPLETVAEVRARLLALRAADPKAWSYRKLAALTGLSTEPIASVINGENVRPETLAMIVAALPPEHMEKTSS